MYKIEVSYRVDRKGLCYARLTCTEADEGFATEIFDDSTTCVVNTEEYDNWESVQEEVVCLLDGARKEIEYRRQLLETKPDDRIVEL